MGFSYRNVQHYVLFLGAKIHMWLAFWSKSHTKPLIQQTPLCVVSAVFCSKLIPFSKPVKASLRNKISCFIIRKVELVLHEESASEVRIEFEEFKTDITALLLAVHTRNVSLIKKLLVMNYSKAHFCVIHASLPPAK